MITLTALTGLQQRSRPHRLGLLFPPKTILIIRRSVTPLGLVGKTAKAM